MATMRMDLLDWEATQFGLDLDEVIVPTHEAAITSLHAVHYDVEGTSHEQVREAEAAGDEGEWQLALNMAGEEEKRARERERIVGWLVLLHMGIVLELKLRKLYEILRTISLKQGTPPARTQGQKRGRGGNTWFRNLLAEYGRFGVNLDSHRVFNFVDEMVFACNSVKHNAGKPTEAYRKFFPHQRFTDGEGIVFSNLDFREAVGSLKEFVEAVVREIKQRRDGKKPVGPLQRPRPRLPV